MRIFPILVVVLSFAAPDLFAQQPLIHNYTFLYDDCPDPVKNHIATRKMYEPYCADTTNRNAPDTLIEYYDPEGKIIAVEEKRGNGLNPHLAERHHLYYDQQGRIILDSSFNYYDDALVVNTFWYTPFKCVVNATPPYKYVEDCAVRIINYYGYGNIESDYCLNAAGDTMCSRIRHSDVLTTYVVRKYLPDSSLTNIDSTAIVTTPLQSWRWIIFYDWEGDTATSLYSDYYNPEGQRIVKVSVHDDILCDCTIYLYENNRLIVEERTVYEDWHNPTPRVPRFTQHELYYYNEKGQLTEIREFTTYPDHYTYGVEITCYTYNEKGLRTEENVYYEDYGTNERKLRRCERWEYTYW